MAMSSGDICLLQYPIARRALWDTWRLQSCPEPGGLSWSHGTRGGSRAALCQEAGAGTMGRVAAPKLPRAGTQELGPWDTWRHLSCHELGGGSWRHERCGGTRAACAGWHNLMSWTRGCVRAHVLPFVLT
jgi:hypothetical protein